MKEERNMQKMKTLQRARTVCVLKMQSFDSYPFLGLLLHTLETISLFEGVV